MKCYHPNTYEKLGFDVVLQWVEERLHSQEAKAALQEMQPMSDPTVLLPELDRVAELQNALEFGDGFPGGLFISTGESLEKLKIKGNWIGQNELFQILRWLDGIASARAYFAADQESYPEMYALLHAFPFEEKLIKRIRGILDERGNLRDDASPELARLRRQQGSTSKELRSTLYKILRQANDQNWSQDKEITIRNDRLVIPIKADFKGRVNGFVQDVSQTGGTVYLEPAAALPLNNHLRELQFKEQNEVIRIMQEISAELGEYVDGLMDFRQVMVQLELIHAKAKLAVAFEAILPQINLDKPYLHLRNARYPLLLLKAMQEEMTVVPISLSLDHKHRILIVSGPNAGGKSVSLKTLGLLQLMLQCGFLVPVEEGSEFRLFESLFLDIGDEQSVDTDLSTYTSRLFQWRQMGDNMDKKSLFLIDEFGSGTDPKQGGAIAESFLERFVNQRSYGIITTHYGNLKDYAEITAGVGNAAMQFDTKGLKPTYTLVEGLPGRSYAFEMAQRVGVHHTILKKARKKVGSEEIDTEKLLRQLEKKNMEISRLLQKNKQKEGELEKLVIHNRIEKEKLKKERKSILREAKVEARNLIQDANRKIENTIREIKEKNAAKKATQKAREKLRAEMPEVESVPVTVKAARSKEGETLETLAGKPVVGDWVKLKSSESFGTLAELQGKRGVVVVGDLRLTVKLDQLSKIKAPKAPKVKASSVNIIGSRNREVKSEADIMGMRVEEALPTVDRFLDNARLSGLNRVRILHGKGTGVLREAIRKHLGDLAYVESAVDAPVEEGGAGWTIVQMK
ncbi:MAG: Smr/MutS family protein [Bacteroidota bacterium]